MPNIATSMPWWNSRSVIDERNRSVVAQSTSPSILSGCWRQTRWATIEPIEKPATITSRSSSTSISAAASSAQSVSENSSDWMPRPCQRWSMVTTR